MAWTGNCGMRRLVFGGSLIPLLVAAASASATTITYNVDRTVGIGRVYGTITTDGTGNLSSSDFVSWNLELVGYGAAYQITNLDAGAIVWGDTNGDVAAT